MPNPKQPMSSQERDLFTWFLIAFLVVALAVLTFMTQSGCLRRAPEIIEKMVPVATPCDLPPVTPLPELAFESCPEPNPVCMTAATATRLLLHLRNREAWIAEAKAACGETDLLPLGDPPESAPDG